MKAIAVEETSLAKVTFFWTTVKEQVARAVEQPAERETEDAVEERLRYHGELVAKRVIGEAGKDRAVAFQREALMYVVQVVQAAEAKAKVHVAAQTATAAESATVTRVWTSSQTMGAPEGVRAQGRAVP